MTDEEKIAMEYLPSRLREAFLKTVGRYSCPIAEIRLRLDGEMSLTLGKRSLSASEKNVSCKVKCTSDELKSTVTKLCGGSLYAHAETIREGVIITADGLRVGVSGRAVVTGGRMDCVRDISSVNMRIPHRAQGAADGLFRLINLHFSTCVVSPPGMGKTTMLRELVPLLAERSRVAVIDTRYELGAGMPRYGFADFYSGWPRSDGIFAAVRTMSPEYIICDEISDSSDAQAIRTASASGVCVIASAHGRTIHDILKNPRIGELFRDGVFGCVCGIEENGVTEWNLP